MSAPSALGSIGAVLSQAQFRVDVQSRVLKEQLAVTDGAGAAALKLIQSSIVAGPSLQRGLDVKA